MSVLVIGWGALLKLNSHYLQVVDKKNNNNSISQWNRLLRLFFVIPVHTGILSNHRDSCIRRSDISVVGSCLRVCVKKQQF
ncbi:MAG: hypothetical protein N2319_08175 [Candidatus Kapabacteria bacterium]|nr:hypothetical protein [Candidatus Kapabacteria bacterium]